MGLQGLRMRSGKHTLPVPIPPSKPDRWVLIPP